MPGRYGNQNGGRGGRGRRRTAEFVVNHIKKTFDHGNDIAEAIRTLTKADTEVWKPTLKTSTETDQDLKQTEEKQYLIWSTKLSLTKL